MELALLTKELLESAFHLVMVLNEPADRVPDRTNGGRYCAQLSVSTPSDRFHSPFHNKLLLSNLFILPLKRM